MIPLIDLHIHSTFSDGKCHPKQIISLAWQKGLHCLAFTDHAFNTELSLNEDTIENYLDEISLLKESSPLKILTGIEAELASLEKAIKYRDRLDLILLSNHGPVNGGLFGSIFEAIADYPVDIIAHPWYFSNSSWDKLIQASLDYSVAIELNGFRKAPKAELIKKAALSGVLFSIGSDAHFENEIGETQWAYKVMQEIGLDKSSIIKHIF